MYIVYKIKNRLNKKSYIGMTKRTLHQRWKAHCSSARQGSKFRFHSAIRKYGYDCWDLEVLFIHDDLNIIRKKEEEYIKSHDTISNRNGYNAKPGGCGGWIVPAEKYDSWKQKITVYSIGERNIKFNGVDNNQLIQYLTVISFELGYIPCIKKTVTCCNEKQWKFPKSFAVYRFGGKYINLVEIVKEKTNLEYKPYFRTPEHRQKLRERNLGRKRNANN